MNQKTSKADELFFVVDEHDQPLDPLPRKLVHGHGVWHRVSHILLINDRQEVLCHQRALTKELDPGIWTASFGGHLAPGEAYLTGAERELKEELGIQAKLKLWRIFKYDNSGNNEFQAVFVARWNGQPADVTFEDGEVEQVAWRPSAEVGALIEARDPHWARCGYEQELLQDVIAGVI